MIWRLVIIPRTSIESGLSIQGRNSEKGDSIIVQLRPRLVVFTMPFTVAFQSDYSFAGAAVWALLENYFLAVDAASPYSNTFHVSPAHPCAARASPQWSQDSQRARPAAAWWGAGIPDFREF